MNMSFGEGYYPTETVKARSDLTVRAFILS